MPTKTARRNSLVLYSFESILNPLKTLLLFLLGLVFFWLVADQIFGQHMPDLPSAKSVVATMKGWLR